MNIQEYILWDYLKNGNKYPQRGKWTNNFAINKMVKIKEKIYTYTGFKNIM